MLVMLANKHTKNACLLCDASNHTARGVPTQDALVRTTLWLTMMKAFPSGNGLCDPKQEDGNDSGGLSPFHLVSICPPPLLGHHPMLTSLLDRSKVIIRPIKDVNGKRTLKLGLIVTMGFKCLSRLSFSSLTHFSSRNCTNYLSLPMEQNPPNPLR
ncbi:hypothetical protein O181_020527 [Austropuccinia psidii MF-1]|uniref:Uncharacterized protein n=1 Tax=Austropuccinia psidii MF-1 TaxID=1389203 RepID=A0A9Q3CDN3_9BASI|nr:hypothetical protein [Austropuccinia psidii MF-1]